MKMVSSAVALPGEMTSITEVAVAATDVAAVTPGVTTAVVATVAEVPVAATAAIAASEVAATAETVETEVATAVATATTMAETTAVEAVEASTTTEVASQEADSAATEAAMNSEVATNGGHPERTLRSPLTNPVGVSVEAAEVVTEANNNPTAQVPTPPLIRSQAVQPPSTVSPDRCTSPSNNKRVVPLSTSPISVKLVTAS